VKNQRPARSKSVSPLDRVAASRSGRPKIQEVARLAGVSLGTVSAVLNGKGRISEATRLRVRETIAQLGYQPDLYASNLARRQTRLFGVIVSSLQNPFFAETAQAVEDEAARHGFQISLMATNFSPKQHRAAVQQLLGARIAGLAVLTSEDDPPSRKLVLASGVPAVFLDIGKPGGACSVVRVDSRGGMSAAVEHLIALGHRDLLYIRNSQQASGPQLLSHRLRDRGFEAAVRSFAAEGLRFHTVDIHGPAADAGEQAIASTFRSARYTAVIATTDMVAMGAYRGLHARNLRIPDAVSVVGFDNTYFSRFMNPPLTTVDVSRTGLSELVVSALLRSSPGDLLRLSTQLILRDSTAPPKRR
jgi:LacI family transcriptional regulator